MCVYLILNQPLNLKNVLFLICLGELPMLLVWKVWNVQKSGKNSTLSSCMLGILHLDVQVVTTSPHLPCFFLYSLTGLGLRCCTWAFSSCGEQGLLSSCDAQASYCFSSAERWLLLLQSLGCQAHGLQKLHTFLSPSFHPSISTRCFILNHLSRQCNVLFSKYKDFFQQNKLKTYRKMHI